MAKRRRKRSGVVRNALMALGFSLLVAGGALWVIWTVTRPAPPPRFAPPTTGRPPRSGLAGPTAGGPQLDAEPTVAHEIEAGERARLEEILRQRPKGSGGR